MRHRDDAIGRSPARAGASRTRMTVIVAVLVATAAGALMWWLVAGSHPAPEPRFVDGASILTSQNGPLPPEYVGGTQVQVQLGHVTAHTAAIKLFGADTAAQAQVRLGIGETAALGDVEIRLCATWVNERRQPPWDDSDGSTDYADKAYFVFGVGDAAPVCPERAD